MQVKNISGKQLTLGFSKRTHVLANNETVTVAEDDRTAAAVSNHVAKGRIEIVRGAQSSLWGSDAVAAVVHVITRSPQSGPGGSAYAESGSFATRNAGLKGSLGGQGWTLQGGIESLATDGSNVSRQGNEKDDADLMTANLSASLAASDSLSLNFGLRAVDAYSQFDPVDYFLSGLPADGDVATDSENLYAHASGVLDSNQRRVVHRFGVRYFDSDNRNLSDGVESSSTASDRISYTYQADIRVGENLLSLAVEREETEFEQRGATVSADPNQRQSMDVTSAIVELQGQGLERLTWIISARADNNSEFDDALNGRLSLAYQLSAETTLRANIGSGQKNPTFIERFGYFPQQFVGNPSLKPERSVSYEIGLDQKLLGGALLLQASLFQQDLKDEINGFVFDPVALVVTAENMTGKSKRSGIELGARWTLSDSFGIGAHYTYTDATELDFLGADIGELRRPRHAGGLSLDFRAPDERYSASLSADYGGTRSDIFFPPYPSPSAIVTLGNYWLLDATTQFEVSDSVTVFLKGSNLLDTDYEQVYGYRTQGRAAYLGVRLNFGR